MKHIVDLLAGCDGFEWDEGNLDKNRIKHSVEAREAEQALINRPIALSDDVRHSESEPRYAALGQTNANRLLAIVFTIRGTKVRVISARDMNILEKGEFYEEAT